MGDQAGGVDAQAGYLVRGRVQGVGFRWWTRRTAQGLGITGSVHNRPDGSVEIRARGNRTALAELERRLRRGPPSAAVRGVESFRVDDVDQTDFVIEP